jgi:hypothetical protein
MDFETLILNANKIHKISSEIWRFALDMGVIIAISIFVCIFLRNNLIRASQFSCFIDIFLDKIIKYSTICIILTSYICILTKMYVKFITGGQSSGDIFACGDVFAYIVIIITCAATLELREFLIKKGLG